MFQSFKGHHHKTWRTSIIAIHVFEMPLKEHLALAFGILKTKWRILLSIPHFHDTLAQPKIITTYMCLHNFIHDSKLYDDHFNTVERGGYVHEDSASYVVEMLSLIMIMRCYESYTYEHCRKSSSLRSCYCNGVTTKIFLLL
jgi:hypothetical protein